MGLLITMPILLICGFLATNVDEEWRYAFGLFVGTFCAIINFLV